MERPLTNEEKRIKVLEGIEGMRKAQIKLCDKQIKDLEWFIKKKVEDIKAHCNQFLNNDDFSTFDLRSIKKTINDTIEQAKKEIEQLKNVKSLMEGLKIEGE